MLANLDEGEGEDESLKVQCRPAHPREKASASNCSKPVIGAHYPAAHIQPNCADLNKTQWSSEDMTVTWNGGAQCWAREVSENYVRANLMSTVAWLLTDSFYDNLVFTAWSGDYQIGQALWEQFTVAKVLAYSTTAVVT